MTHTNTKNKGKLQRVGELLPKFLSMGKKTKDRHKYKNIVNTFTILKLLHINLFDSSIDISINASSCSFIIVNDYTRHT